MSSTSYLPAGYIPPPVAAGSKTGTKRGKPSVMGLCLFVLGLSVAASGFESLRVSFAGLQVHMYLLLMAPLFLVVTATHIGSFPWSILVALIVFCSLYVISTLSAGFSLEEMLKIAAAAATIITAALMVRNEGDVRAAVLGLNVAMALLAFVALRAPVSASEDLNPMNVGNKNTYSLYALPAMLLAGHLILRKESAGMLYKGLLGCCLLPQIVVIAMGANRSGWLGIALIGLMLFKNNRARGLIFLVLIGGVVYFWITQYGTTDVIKKRVGQTVEGIQSDKMRKELFFEAMAVGFDNPLTGVSPQDLPFELAKRLNIGRASAPHNVFAHLMGGSGMLCTAALIAVAVCMWRLSPGGKNKPSPEFISARKVLRMMVILWAFRGMFTHEILYSPGFCLALGIAIGATTLAAARSRAENRPAMNQGWMPAAYPAA